MSDSMSQHCPNCEAQAAEIERLTGCLTKANAQAEHFEREWYLRGDEIERLREALRDTAEVIESCNTVFLHKLGTTNKWRNAVLAKARAALAANEHLK